LAVLVTRPEPDNARTAEALRARGYDVLVAPLLRFESLRCELGRADVSGVVITSANALRAVKEDEEFAALRTLPLFAVGERTGHLARESGFKDVRVASGDVGALIALTRQSAPTRLLYIAGEDTSRDLPAELAALRIEVRTVVAYRMVPVQNFSAEVSRAFGDGTIEAVLHYSRRSAQVFADLARNAPNALAVPQCCLSPAIAEVLSATGTANVVSAARPREQDLLEMLDRTLGRAQK
jgi:uroporphyrinogen-III synthase